MPYVHLEDARLYYQTAGDGPAALFIHGFPFDRRVWVDQLESLAGLRRCIAVDLRGFGRSSSHHGPALTMETHANDAAAALGELGVAQADVIGLSMGGYVALALLEAHPGLVRSLALVDTKAAADTAEAKAGRDAAKERLVSEGREAFAAGMAETLLGPDPSHEAAARLRDMMEETRYETILAALEGMKQRPDRAKVLAAATCPVLVVVGEHDQLTPPEGAKDMADLVGASAKVIPNAGHVTPIEEPAAFNSTLRMFLGRLSTNGR